MEYEFTLTGRSPILFHADDVMATDALKEWQKDPKNKGLSVAGDDRSPPWTWQVYLYHDGENLVIPQENIMACLRKASARIPLPKGKGTFKDLSQSGLIISSEFCDFFSRGAKVSMKPIAGLAQKPFKEQFDAVKKLGFDLKVKRAKPPGSSSKHVRVRAMFSAWSVKGVIEVLEPIITEEVLRTMFDLGGRYVGLLDWRPGSPMSPGPYGMFRSELKAIS